MKQKTFFFLALMLLGLRAVAVTEHEIDSKFIASPAKVSVALPSGYDGKNLSERYPVVYLLNGYGGNHQSWPGIIDLDSLATVNRVIIVCPDGRDSWYWDSPANPQMKMESYITKELVGWVDSTYNTRANPQGRAITGLSMGGHGGLWIGLRHPELFANAGSTSGGVDIRPFPKRWKIAKWLGPKESNPRRWNESTVATLIERVTPGKCNIIFDCGTEDFFYKVNCALDRAMTRRGIQHTYLTSPGGHSPAYWRKSIQPQLRFFKSKFYPAK
ncbi:MAG: esterase family protein [Paramuribaculum sp.]|nr:esterase family protein [Paramuribaculum sp.]MDE6322971.1 esterase family protein [Paramuribaculum sp.]MDE6489071.1 esterase family protein [Paramuribaculum sp.]